MKTCLLLTLLLSSCCCFANDTLTRAEVYNFAVNDTFDYFHSWYHGSIFVPRVVNTVYKRFVISETTWSQDSLIKYTIRKQLSPIPFQNDTLVLNKMSDYELIAMEEGVYFPQTVVATTDTTPFW